MKPREHHAAPTSGQPATSPDASTPAMLYQAGQQHRQAGRYSEALACCDQALTIGPDDADILYLAGLLALEESQCDRAVAWFSRAIRLTPRVEFLSALGTALQRLGRLEEALQVFDKAVQLRPDAPGWKNLANLLFELQRADLARQAYLRVLDLDPRDWDAACRVGYLCYQSGQLEEALAHFGICDQLRPNNAATLHMRAMFLLGLGRFEHAAAEGIRAQALDPDNADTCNNVALAFRELRRHEQALFWFDKALELRPRFDAALYGKAVMLAKLQRIDEALVVHDRLAAVRGPDSPISDLDFADLLIELDRRENALAMLDACDRKRPDHAATLQRRAVCLHGLKLLERSLADSRRAHELDPDNAGICNNIGVVLHELGRHQEALRWLAMAIDRRPDYVDALNNTATTQVQLHRLADAAASFDRVKAIDPDNAMAALGAAHLDLLHGNFETGWAAREARWKVPGLPIVYPKFSQPMWLGQEDIAGKTILVYADEGMGDALQLARYLPMLAALGACVILVVHDALHALVSDVSGVSLCLPQRSTAALPSFDMYCPMLSLPLAFGTRLETIPGNIPYLPLPSADSIQAWNERLPPRDRLRVGLVWAGNPNHSNDFSRSIPLPEFARLLDVDAHFISLQKDLRPDDKSVLEQFDIVDLTADLSSFSETAALICCLDLVITVDTSVAHLSGALGRPTWILLPQSPDYRWMLGREDSPWYPTVKLFRQTATREYASVLDRMRPELAALSRSRETP